MLMGHRSANTAITPIIRTTALPMDITERDGSMTACFSASGPGTGLDGAAVGAMDVAGVTGTDMDTAVAVMVVVDLDTVDMGMATAG